MIQKVREACERDDRLVPALMRGAFSQGEGHGFSDVESYPFLRAPPNASGRAPRHSLYAERRALAYRETWGRELVALLARRDALALPAALLEGVDRHVASVRGRLSPSSPPPCRDGRGRRR